MDLANSSEVREAAALLGRFRDRGRMLSGKKSASSSAFRMTSSRPASASRNSRMPAHLEVTRPIEPVMTPSTPSRSPRVATESRGGRIEEILESMCLQGGFQGAVVADQGGLAVAEYNCPVETDAVVVWSSLFGEAVERAGNLLEQKDANHMTMDVNSVDKVVLRRFLKDEKPYYLLVICSRDVDERSEVELSIDRVIGALSSNATR